MCFCLHNLYLILQFCMLWIKTTTNILRLFHNSRQDRDPKYYLRLILPAFLHYAMSHTQSVLMFISKIYLHCSVQHSAGSLLQCPLYSALYSRHCTAALYSARHPAAHFASCSPARCIQILALCLIHARGGYCPAHSNLNTAASIHG